MASACAASIEAQDFVDGLVELQLALLDQLHGAGAVAFTRIGDATGEFSPAATIVQLGEVDLAALTA